MDRKSDVEFVFTAACIREKSHGQWNHGVSRDTQGCLLFGQRTGDLDLHNREYHVDIAKSEVTRRYLGTTFIILPFVNHVKKYWESSGTKSAFLIATNSVDQTCREALDQAKGLPVTLVKDGTVEYTDGLAIRDACGLPDKFVVGCGECPSTTALPNTCALVRMSDLSTPEFNVETYTEDIEYWRTHIGRFYAIGPALTCLDPVAEGARPIHTHDFKRINEMREQRQKGATERARRLRFKNEVCSQCSMKKPCFAEGGRARCSGYYPPPHQIANEILSNIHIPFTEKQMRILLLNSGLFQKYYKNRKCFGTLRVRDRALQYVLNCKTEPGNYTAGTLRYDEAVSWIKKYHGDPVFPDNPAKFKRQEKAALLELASRGYSPRYYNGWRSTTYDLWCITQEYQDRFCTTYAWASGRATLPWRVRVSNIEDVYLNFQNFKYAGRTDHPLCYRY